MTALNLLGAALLCLVVFVVAFDMAPTPVPARSPLGIVIIASFLGVILFFLLAIGALIFGS